MPRHYSDLKQRHPAKPQKATHRWARRLNRDRLRKVNLRAIRRRASQEKGNRPSPDSLHNLEKHLPKVSRVNQVSRSQVNRVSHNQVSPGNRVSRSRDNLVSRGNPVSHSPLSWGRALFRNLLKQLPA